MKQQLSFFLLLLLFLFIFGCNKSVNKSGREPAKVTLISASSDTSRIETGIDAIPENDAIQIEWKSSTDELVTGYFLYRSSDIETFEKIASISGEDTVYVDNSVEIYQRYYYFLRAVSADNIVSEPSDTVNYLLVRKADKLFIEAGSDPSHPVFNWNDPNTPPESAYILRLLNSVTGDYIWISEIPSSYGDGFESVRYNLDGNAGFDSLSSGIEYSWRIDIRGSGAASGSESQWASYIVTR